jgi:hypothetical protein
MSFGGLAGTVEATVLTVIEAFKNVAGTAPAVPPRAVTAASDNTAATAIGSRPSRRPAVVSLRRRSIL